MARANCDREAQVTAALPLAHQPFFPREGQFSSPGHTQIIKIQLLCNATTMLSKVEEVSPKNRNIVLIIKEKVRYARKWSYPIQKVITVQFLFIPLFI